MSKVAFYVLFAIIATLVNLFGQEVTTMFVGGQYELFLSMLVGTALGLVVKYLLDKKFIFQYTTETSSKDLMTFILYSGMGVVTTCIFWVTEYAFDAWFDTKTMRYVGAVIGLSIGYITKYYLDKKFVFVER
jgi:putative flippase GtrA